MRIKWPRIENAGFDRGNRLSHSRDVHLWIAFVGIDDVEPTPVPELHVYLTWSVLVITSDDEASSLARKLTRQIERLLSPGCFDDALTTTPMR